MSHVQRGLATALPLPNAVMQDVYGWNRSADMRVGKTARDNGQAPPRPDMSGDTKARRRLVARASAHDKITSKLTPAQVRAFPRPGSLKKPWPAGRGRHH